jgi:hypothetical protein
MDTPQHQADPDDLAPHNGAGNVTRLVRIHAPTPDFLPPLDGESAMLLHLLGQAFTDLIEGA